MSKPSRRANCEQIKAQRKQYKQAQKILRQNEKAQGLKAPSPATISNHKCEYQSAEQERCARNEAFAEKMRIFRSRLPVLLISRIRETLKR